MAALGLVLFRVRIYIGSDRITVKIKNTVAALGLVLFRVRITVKIKKMGH